jgi:biopolymer transport protein ExbB
MNQWEELLRQGGVVLAAILLLSFLLYERCLRLLLDLARGRRWLQREGARRLRRRDQLAYLTHDYKQTYRHRRQWISLLITAAPLLGLLGTVMGMIRTFDTLGRGTEAGLAEGMAHGISMALVTTEAGLAVAIPAVLMLYYAHRLMQKGLQELMILERRLAEEVLP